MLEEGLSVKVVLLPPEDDPDSFAKSHSLIEIREYIEENEQDFISLKSDLLLKDTGRDPIARARAIGEIVQSVSVVADPILRGIYAEMVAEKLDQKPEAVLAKIAEFRRKKRALDRSRRRLEEQPLPEYPVAEPQYPAEEGEPLVADMPETGIRDAYLAVPERELTYYLVKFGEYPLHFEEDMYYGREPGAEITVSQYIRDALADDDLSFVNEPYHTIFDRYYAFAASLPAGEDCEERQKRVIRYFTTDEDQALNRAVFGLILEEHPLTVKTYEESLTPEPQALGRTVPKSVLLYKRRITDEECTATTKAIQAAQKSGDQDTLRTLVRKLQILNTVKNRLSKELNRL